MLSKVGKTDKRSFARRPSLCVLPGFAAHWLCNAFEPQRHSDTEKSRMGKKNTCLSFLTPLFSVSLYYSSIRFFAACEESGDVATAMATDCYEMRRNFDASLLGFFSGLSVPSVLSSLAAQPRCASVVNCVAKPIERQARPRVLPGGGIRGRRRQEAPKQQRPEQCAQRGAGEGAALGFVGMLRLRLEGKPGDEQRHGEADAGQAAGAAQHFDIHAGRQLRQS